MGRTYLDIHDAGKNEVEEIFDTLPFDDRIKNAHFEYLRLTHRGHYNGVTILNDDRLMLDELEYTLFLHERVNAIVMLNDFVEQNGAQFLYVRIPSKLEDNSLLPLAFSDNSIIEDTTRLKELIAGSGVDVLDLRAEMKKDGVDFTSAFFRGDHHWTVDTALWAFGKIGEFANNVYGFNVNEMTWDPSQFKHIVYEDNFLGEESVAINALDNIEDIKVLVPKFHTDFVITDLRGYNYMQILDAGDFANVFVPYVNHEHVGRLVFGDSNRWFSGLTRYENVAATENKRVLLIADSMGIPLSSYFANAFTVVDKHYLESRANHRIWYAIENYGYDLVVYAVSDVVVTNEKIDEWHLDRLFLGHP